MEMSHRSKAYGEIIVEYSIRQHRRKSDPIRSQRFRQECGSRRTSSSFAHSTSFRSILLSIEISLDDLLNESFVTSFYHRGDLFPFLQKLRNYFTLTNSRPPKLRGWGVGLFRLDFHFSIASTTSLKGVNSPVSGS